MQLITPKEAEALRKYAQYLDDHAEDDFRLRLSCVDRLSAELRRMRRTLWWIGVRLWLSRALDVALLALAVACAFVGILELMRRVMEGR